MRFTETQAREAIKKLTPKGKHSDPETRGLQLVIGARTATWYLKKKQPLSDASEALGNAGATLSIKLGQAPLDPVLDIDSKPLPPLETARTLARAIAAQIDSDKAYRPGETEERARRRWDNSFVVSTADDTPHLLGDLHERLCEGRLRSGKKEKTINDYRRTVINNLGHWLHRDIRTIGHHEVESLINGLLADGKNATAWAVRRRIASVFRFARRYHPTLSNPAEKGMLDMPPPNKSPAQHDLFDAWMDVESLEDPLRRGLFKILILTGARFEDCLQTLEWRQVDLDAKVMKLEKMKNGLDRDMPLSEAAVEVLRDLPQIDDADLVFPNMDGSVRKQLKRLMHCRPKDCRTYFSEAANTAGLDHFQIEFLRGGSLPGSLGNYLFRGSHELANKVATQIMSEVSTQPDLKIIA